MPVSIRGPRYHICMLLQIIAPKHCFLTSFEEPLRLHGELVQQITPALVTS